jgi:hypothetical protein
VAHVPATSALSDSVHGHASDPRWLGVLSLMVNYDAHAAETKAWEGPGALRAGVAPELPQLPAVAGHEAVRTTFSSTESRWSSRSPFSSMSPIRSTR